MNNRQLHVQYNSRTIAKSIAKVTVNCIIQSTGSSCITNTYVSMPWVTFRMA